MITRPVVEASKRVRDYAAWYTWARRHVTDTHRCHLAAQAALEAVDHKAGNEEAASLAQKAASLTDAHAYRLTADTRTQVYARWYAWAVLELNLGENLAHRAAYEAAEVESHGKGPKAAAEAALQAVGLAPAEKPGLDGLLNDRGVRSVIFGVVCLGAFFFLPFYFPILPILGLLYALRALRSPRLAVGAAGLVLNGIAMVLTVMQFLRLY